MTKGVRLGELEILVLSAILCVGEDGYGLRLVEEIAARTGRVVSVGAIYTTLYRLEAKGLLTSRKGQPLPVRGGRAKRCFLVSPPGKRALSESLTALDAMTRDLRPDLGLA